ncbi:MAG: AEC family transporter [Eubacteriales bacterium]|nr:AEC family transporter [Eubacteriales bacterium]
MVYFMITLKQIIELFFIIFLGYIAFKKNIVTEESKKSFSGILINIVVPAVIINSFQSQQDLSKLKSLLFAFFLAVFVHIFLIILSSLIIRKSSGPNYKLERVACIYSNAGFMGIPLLSALFGENGAFYASLYVVVFNVFLWTQGVWSLTGFAEKGDGFKGIIKKLTTPTIISVIFSFILYILQIRLPEMILEPIRYVADMNTPFAMLVTGITIASAGVHGIFNKRIGYIVFLKQFILPAALVFVFRLLGFVDETSVCILVTAICPSAAMIPMMALQYDQDEKAASGIFVFSTLISLISVPLFMLFI